MSLPVKKNELFYNIKLPSGKNLDYRPWRVKEEKDLMFAIEGVDDRDKILPHLLSLLQSCIKDGEIEKLSPVDIMAFAIEIFKKAKGEEVEIYYTCPHCDVKIGDPIYIDLSEATTIKKFNGEPIEIGDYIFAFKELDYKTQNILAEKYKDSVRKFKFYHLVACLSSVILNGESHNHFTPAEAETFFEEMEIKEFEDLLQKFNENYSDINIAKITPCEACQKDVRVFVDDLVDFFV